MRECGAFFMGEKLYLLGFGSRSGRITQQGGRAGGRARGGLVLLGVLAFGVVSCILFSWVERLIRLARFVCDNRTD